ncbi:hypothetical protein IVB18_35820 [Bradyrhizobium sp. 186]|uniref:hypothetical protein n=1 Tax=Bradyrhizobium sp. 186 TaxID=2782654 RepID=UPI002001012D|nr:hypothetical protein [Bradyrhizobium sp. 186]UPK33535.1 hypothetical protein IVB18_35820 [Bradyrhizobium sp. 186]
MKTPKSFAMSIRLLPVLMVGIALAVATGDASAGNGARPGTGNTGAKIQSGGGGTALLVEKPAPGGPIGKPLPPVPIPGKGDGRVGHDGSSSHKHGDRYRYERRHRHSRYESPPIIGKHPGRTSQQSDLFRRGVVGPQPGG